MAAGAKHNTTSMETILTFENRNVSQWSMVWSTANIPGMDTASGGGASRHGSGRRRLRIGTFVLGGLLTMHCRVTATAFSGGFFVFLVFLVMAVALLANPLRHFEVYLGQWSISGPGRAFRIIPMFDGIGMAICISAIVRAISCCTMAAITAVYVWHAVADARLPYTYCRDFNLRTYEPILMDIKLRRRQFQIFGGKDFRPSTVGLFPKAWRNASLPGRPKRKKLVGKPRQIKACKEVYSGRYPPLFNTPAYNFFYVEMVQLRPDLKLDRFNTPLLISIVATWLTVWLVMISEKILHGRLIWNNMITWLAVIPCLWAILMIIIAITNYVALKKLVNHALRLDAMEIVSSISDAFQVAMYIHSASTGTEVIHGKGLNHYASGHIDPLLNAENVWHSALVLLLAALNCTSAIICALVDYSPSVLQDAFKLHESTMWVLPMFSRCVSSGSHSHFVSALTFGGLTFSYMVVTYIMLKTALHTIFEYRVRLVFIEQVLVAVLVLGCMALSLFFATHGGIALLDSVDAVMTGLAMPLVCVLELAGMLYVYRSHDFVSDIDVATEDNTCSSRISTQWKIIPFITLAVLLMKITVIMQSDLPKDSLYIALTPLLAIMLAVPIRACFNAYDFFHNNKIVA